MVSGDALSFFSLGGWRTGERLLEAPAGGLSFLRLFRVGGGPWGRGPRRRPTDSRDRPGLRSGWPPCGSGGRGSDCSREVAAWRGTGRLPSRTAAAEEKNGGGLGGRGGLRRRRRRAPVFLSLLQGRGQPQTTGKSPVPPAFGIGMGSSPRNPGMGLELSSSCTAEIGLPNTAAHCLWSLAPNPGVWALAP